jgi:hypothetical protein
VTAVALGELRAEGQYLQDTLCAVDLVESALRDG